MTYIYVYHITLPHISSVNDLMFRSEATLHQERANLLHKCGIPLPDDFWECLNSTREILVNAEQLLLLLENDVSVQIIEKINVQIQNYNYHSKSTSTEGTTSNTPVVTTALETKYPMTLYESKYAHVNRTMDVDNFYDLQIRLKEGWNLVSVFQTDVNMFTFRVGFYS